MANFQPKKLNDQVILITGATSGIGLATAKLAAAQGAKVVMNGRNEKELKKCASSIRTNGGNAIAAAGDISRLSDIEKIRDKALEEFGGIDTWVNNAGVALYGELMDGNFEDERQLFEINFWGTRMCSHVAVKTLMKNGGTLINVGSELSELAPPVLGAYSASKHAIKAFTDALRIEIYMKKLPVGVCLIRPTSIATPMPEHGTNQLRRGEPSLPSMLYHPDVVARVILRTAVNPQRDVFVGAQARLSSLSSILFPGITDTIAALRAGSMMRGMAKPHKKEDENLREAASEEGKVEGRYGRFVFKRSLYSDLTTLGFRNTFKLYTGLDKNIL